MARHAKRQAIGLWMNGIYVGEWRISSRGVHTLAYAQEWRDSIFARPISLSLPIEEDHHGPVVERYFDNLLPDNKAIRSRLQEKFGASSDSAFDLLSEIGRDCVGALQLLPAGEVPPPADTITGEELDNEQISQLLDNVLMAGRHADLDDFRISVAGAQEKTALLFWQGGWKRPTDAIPTTHLLKLPIGRHNDLQIDLSTSVDNEWICSRILNAFKIPVAEARPETFGKHRVLVVTRFDRRVGPEGKSLIRRPQEDMCQVFGVGSSSKYEDKGGPGIQQIMHKLLASDQYAYDREVFFKAQIIFWMLAAIDGHAKNFSIHLGDQGRFSLQPLYDVLSAHPYLRTGGQSGIGGQSLEAKKIKMAMAWSGENRHYRWSEIEPRHFISTGRRCGLQPTFVEQMLDELVADTPSVVETVGKECAEADKAVLDRILAGLSAAADRIQRTRAAPH